MHIRPPGLLERGWPWGWEKRRAGGGSGAVGKRQTDLGSRRRVDRFRSTLRYGFRQMLQVLATMLTRTRPGRPLQSPPQSEQAKAGATISETQEPSDRTRDGHVPRDSTAVASRHTMLCSAFFSQVWSWGGGAGCASHGTIPPRSRSRGRERSRSRGEGEKRKS